MPAIKTSIHKVFHNIAYKGQQILKIRRPRVLLMVSGQQFVFQIDILHIKQVVKEKFKLRVLILISYFWERRHKI